MTRVDNARFSLNCFGLRTTLPDEFVISNEQMVKIESSEIFYKMMY